ncbi:glycosyltransferase family 2 protein [bacterium]|nr:glycosyltransferase family 2 protein [bacterium]
MTETGSKASAPELSIVVPIYNEEDCLPEVLLELRQALDDAGITSWETVVVDDGSVDTSAAKVEKLRAEDPRFRLLRFVRNCGQTAAFDAGFRAARGRIVGMMDGDGQNDPRDFPRLIEEMKRRDVDMMCGYRAIRQDSIVRKISSRIGNGVRNGLTGNIVRDVGCSIRVFKRDCIDRIKLFEGMHRFFPTLFKIEGYTISEMPVNHRPREKGKSKYGIGNRAWRGLKDLMAVRWMQRRALHYQLRPEK